MGKTTENYLEQLRKEEDEGKFAELMTQDQFTEFLKNVLGNEDEASDRLAKTVWVR